MTAAHDLVQTRICKVTDCTREAVETIGPYALLCEEHRRLRREKAPAGGARQRSNGRPADFQEKVKALVAAAKKVDRARGRYTEAKSELEDALTDWRIAVGNLKVEP